MASIDAGKDPLMKRASLLFATAATLIAAFAAPGPATAHHPYHYIAEPFACNDRPVDDLYRRPYLGHQAPAVFLGYVYRPYYRYSAYRVYPRTYVCDYRPSYDPWPQWRDHY
jgi:hypothetical protein